MRAVDATVIITEWATSATPRHCFVMKRQNKFSGAPAIQALPIARLLVLTFVMRWIDRFVLVVSFHKQQLLECSSANVSR